MASDANFELDEDDLLRLVGDRTFQRGLNYAEGGRVASASWNPATGMAEGQVFGSGATYRTVIQLFETEDGRYAVDQGNCSCPVGRNCKHTVALALVASEDAESPVEVTSSARTSGDRDWEGRSWEARLEELLSADSGSDGDPLAIELELGEGRQTGKPVLMARLMRPGSRTRWINDSLQWGLDRFSPGAGSLRDDHVQIAREINALQALELNVSGSLYAGVEKQQIDLARAGQQIWPLLRRAEESGIELIETGPGQATIPAPVNGRMALDIRRDRDNSITAIPELQVDGADADELEPVLFIGKTGHGLVCRLESGDDVASPSDSSSSLRLIRLDRPVPPELQRLLLESGRLEIPARDAGRFTERYSPALSRLTTLTSSDDSFEPPSISAPRLVLDIHHLQPHEAQLAWTFAYTIDGDEQLVDPDESSDAYRDQGAERALLAAAHFDRDELRKLGLVDEEGKPSLEQRIETEGPETLRLCTQILPELREADGIELVESGDEADYEEVAKEIEIGVSTEAVKGQSDWFDLDISVSVDGQPLPFSELFVALASGDEFMLLDDGTYFSLQDPRLQTLRQLIEEARELSISDSDEEENPRISRYQADLWAELTSVATITGQADAWREQVQALIDLDELPEPDLPAGLEGSLRPYQREGFNWLAAIWELGLGGILADEMGLGKTLQALALISHIREERPEQGPALVVAPRSVIGGWVGEAEGFTPGLDVRMSTDTLNKSGVEIDELVDGADIVVTSYNLFRLDQEAYASVGWSALILDEAQFVKNRTSKTYRAARELATPFKLALTGTPLENRLSELWSLLSITAPGLFADPKAFDRHFARPIERDGDKYLLETLRRRIRPLVKRRTKAMVATDLPPKLEQSLLLDLTPGHRRIYDQHLQRERQKILGLLGEFERNRFSILSSITRLRQLSLDPELVGAGSGGTDDGGKGDGPGENGDLSAKLEYLVDHLEELADNGHRALVFSQFTGYLGLARRALEERGISYSYLDGSTRDREEVIAGFKQGDDPAFLISLKAGGFGLNLTEADYCFLLDPWWNPAVENQAIDRTHRIGQDRPVNVYRLISRGTIEEKVIALAQRKADLFKGVIDDGEMFASSINADDIRGLVG